MDNFNISHEEDRRLLSKCISGQPETSELFVREFSNLVYKSVRHTLITRQTLFNKEDLEDLHNTVFLQLFENRCKKLKQYEGRNGCSLASWIRIVTVRIVLNQLRKKGPDAMTQQVKNIPLEDLPELKMEVAEPGADMEKAEQNRLLRDGIRNLSPRDRLFMKLHIDKGLPIEEVAEIMRLSIINAYSVKHRAIQRLKSYIITGEKE